MAQYSNAQLLVNVFAQYPRLNQTYKYERTAGEKGLSVPCAPTDDKANYELNVRMTKDQAKELYSAMKVHFNEMKKDDWAAMAPATEKVIDEVRRKGVFEIDDDGMYVAKTKLAGHYEKSGLKEVTNPPLQFDSLNNVLPRDFMLTSGSEINVGVQLYAYSMGKDNASVALRIKEVMVLKLVPMKERTRQSSFAAVEGGFQSVDGFATGFPEAKAAVEVAVPDATKSDASVASNDDFDDGPAPALVAVPNAPKPKPKSEAKIVVDNEIDAALKGIEFDEFDG